MNAKKQALELIRKKDEEFGEGWSNDIEEIARLMVEFQNSTLKDIKQIMENSTPNRRYYKGWEERVLDLCKETDPYLQTR